MSLPLVQHGMYRGKPKGRLHAPDEEDATMSACGRPIDFMAPGQDPDTVPREQQCRHSACRYVWPLQVDPAGIEP